MVKNPDNRYTIVGCLSFSQNYLPNRKIADMSETAIDLCQTLIAEMQRLEFRGQSIAQVQSSAHYQTSLAQQPLVQKTYLTLTLANLLNSGTDVVPSEIRLGLNMAGNITDWLTDIKLIVLPFLKANEDLLFRG